MDYAPASTVDFLEQSTVAAAQPEIISDYVRGPQPGDSRQQGRFAGLQGGLTASLQGSQRPFSALNPASGQYSLLAGAQHKTAG